MAAQKPARKVPVGTFTQPKTVEQFQGRDRNDPNWDWRNPHDNPSGVKPVTEKPHKYKGEYNASLYPSLGDEYNTPLFHPDLISHLRADEYGAKIWDKMPETEQIKAQIEFVSDFRHPMFNGSMESFTKWVDARAKLLQSKIKRCDPKDIDNYVLTLKVMAEGAHEIGPLDLIDELKLTPEEREAVFDAFFK